MTQTEFLFNSIRYRMAVLVVLLCGCLPAQAVDYENFAIKLGIMQHEDPAYDSAVNLGLTIGGSMLKGDFYSLGLQIEMNTSVVEGRTDTFREDWEMDNHAIYAALRMGKSHYFKLKAGYIDWQVRYDNAPDVNGNGLSWGIAYGYPLRKRRTLELEYAVMSDEDNFGIAYINLGYYF